MLDGMDPQLNKVEALTEPGCYSLTFSLATGEERAVVARLRNGVTEIPAKAFTGWSEAAESYRATVAVVQALQQARELSRPTGKRLLDVEGGWDVSLGNIVLVAGKPACVTHGALELQADSLWRCAQCGAAATYG
jgi:hypothetical protein